MNFDLKTCNNCNIDDILNSIDKKISKEAKNILNNQIYNLHRKNCDDINNDLIDDLYYYRNILIKKSYNDPCLCNFNMNQIISKIKKLIK